MDKVKYCIGLLAGAIGAGWEYMLPIQWVMFLMIAASFGNFIVGWHCARFANGESFSFTKAFRAVTELCVFVTTIASLYIIGDKVGGGFLDSQKAIMFISYVMFYFYAVSVFKNLNRAFPESKLFTFMYYVLSMEIAKMIPFINRYVNERRENEKEHISDKG